MANLQDTITLLFQTAGIEASVRSLSSIDRVLSDVQSATKYLGGQFGELSRNILYASNMAKAGKSTFTDSANEYKRLGAILNDLTQEHIKQTSQGKLSRENIRQQEAAIKQLTVAYEVFGGILKGQANSLIKASGGESALRQAAGIKEVTKQYQSYLDMTRQAIAATESGKSSILGQISQYNALKQSLNILTQNYIQQISAGKLSGAQRQKEEASIRVLNTAVNNLGTAVKANVKSFVDAAGGITAFGKSTGVAKDQIMAFLEANNGIKNSTADFATQMEGAIERLLKYRIAWGFIRGSINQVKDALNEFIKINSQLAQLAIVVNPVQNSIEGLRQTAFSLAKQFGVTTSEVLDSFNTWSRVGLQGKDIVDAASATLIGVNALGMDVSRVTDALTSVMFTYGVAASGTTKVISSWLAVANAFPLAASDLANGLFAVGSAAKEVGIDLNDLSGYIAAINAITRKSGTAIGQSLKTQLARLVKPETEQLFNELGIAIRSTADEYRDMDNVLGELAEQWDKLSDVQRTNIAVAVGGIRRYVDFIALMDNWDIKTRAVALAQSATNQALRANEITMASFSKQLQTLNTQIDNFKYAIGQDLAQSLLGVVHSATSFFEILSSPVLSKTISELIKLATVFSTVGISLAAVTFLSKGFSTLLNITTALFPSLTGLGLKLIGVGTAARSAAAGVGFLDKVLSLSLVYRIVAIAGIVSSLILAWDAFGSSTEELTSDFSEFEDKSKETVSALQDVADAHKQIVDSLGESQKKIIENLSILQSASAGTNEYQRALSILDAEINSLRTSYPLLADEIEKTKAKITAGEKIPALQSPDLSHSQSVIDFTNAEADAKRKLADAELALQLGKDRSIERLKNEIPQVEKSVEAYTKLVNVAQDLVNAVSKTNTRTNQVPNIKIDLTKDDYGVTRFSQTTLANLQKAGLDIKKGIYGLSIITDNSIKNLIDNSNAIFQELFSNPNISEDVKNNLLKEYNKIQDFLNTSNEKLTNRQVNLPIKLDENGQIDLVDFAKQYQNVLDEIGVAHVEASKRTETFFTNIITAAGQAGVSLSELKGKLKELQNPTAAAKTEDLKFFPEKSEQTKLDLQFIEFLRSLKEKSLSTIGDITFDIFRNIDYSKLKQASQITGSFFDENKVKGDLLLQSYQEWQGKILDINKQLKENDNERIALVEELEAKKAKLSTADKNAGGGKTQSDYDIVAKSVKETELLQKKNVANKEELVRNRQALQDMSDIFNGLPTKAKEFYNAIAQQEISLAKQNTYLENRVALLDTIASISSELGMDDDKVANLKLKNLEEERRIRTQIINTSNFSDKQREIELDKLDSELWRKKVSIITEAAKQTSEYKDALATVTGAGAIREDLQKAFTIDFTGNADKVKGIQDDILQTQIDINEARAKGDTNAASLAEYRLKQLRTELSQYTNFFKILGHSIGNALTSLADAFNKRLSENFVNKVLDISIGGEDLDVKLSEAMSKGAGMMSSNLDVFRQNFINSLQETYLKEDQALGGALVSHVETLSGILKDHVSALEKVFSVTAPTSGPNDEALKSLSEIWDKLSQSTKQTLSAGIGTDNTRGESLNAAQIADKYGNIILKAAKATGLDPKIIQGIIQRESSGNQYAVSPAGAKGLMQLMPDTAAEVGVKNLDDAAENILGGAKYFKSILDKFGGNITLALAGYNAGPNNKAVLAGRIPQNKETPEYVAKVLQFIANAPDIGSVAEPIVAAIQENTNQGSDNTKAIVQAYNKTSGIGDFKMLERKLIPFQQFKQESPDITKQPLKKTEQLDFVNFGPLRFPKVVSESKKQPEIKGIGDLRLIDDKAIKAASAPTDFEEFTNAFSRLFNATKNPVKKESDIKGITDLAQATQRLAAGFVAKTASNKSIKEMTPQEQFVQASNRFAQGVLDMLGATKTPKATKRVGTGDLKILEKPTESSIPDYLKSPSVVLENAGKTLLDGAKEFQNALGPLGKYLVGQTKPQETKTAAELHADTKSASATKRLTSSMFTLADDFRHAPEPKSDATVPDLLAKSADTQISSLATLIALNESGVITNEQLKIIADRLFGIQPKKEQSALSKQLTEAFKASALYLGNLLSQSLVASIWKGNKGAAVGGQLGSQFGSIVGQNIFSKALGSTLGTAVGGPVGMVVGGLLGGAIGSLFGGKKKEEPPQIKAIEANTAAIEANTNALKNLDASVLNAPSTFLAPIAGGGRAAGGSGGNIVNIAIHATNATAQEVAMEVQKIIATDYNNAVYTTGSNQRYAI